MNGDGPGISPVNESERFVAAGGRGGKAILPKTPRSLTIVYYRPKRSQCPSGSARE